MTSSIFDQNHSISVVCVWRSLYFFQFCSDHHDPKLKNVWNDILKVLTYERTHPEDLLVIQFIEKSWFLTKKTRFLNELNGEEFFAGWVLMVKNFLHLKSMTSELSKTVPSVLMWHLVIFYQYRGKFPKKTHIYGFLRKEKI